MMLQLLHERAFAAHDWQHVLASFRTSQDFERIGLRRRGGNLQRPRLSASRACLHTYVLHTAIAEDGGRVNCVLAKRKSVPKDVYEGCLQIRMHVHVPTYQHQRVRHIYYSILSIICCTGRPRYYLRPGILHTCVQHHGGHA
jgi:hypothetical protein